MTFFNGIPPALSFFFSMVRRTGYQSARPFPIYAPINLQEYADWRGVSKELGLRALNAAAETERLFVEIS
jgi:hypothetical protein